MFSSSILWLVALFLAASGAFSLVAVVPVVIRVLPADVTKGVSLLPLLIGSLVRIAAGGALARRRGWSRYVIYLVVAWAAGVWLYGLWPRDGRDAPAVGSSVLSAGSVAVLLLGGVWVFFYFRDHADVLPQPPRWWSGVYVFAAVWLALLPLFASTSSHFGPGFFPAMASILLVPALTAVLFADCLLRILLAAQRPPAAAFRRWTLFVSAGLFLAYALVWVLFSLARA